MSSLPAEGHCRGHSAVKTTWFCFISQRCLALLCWNPVPICLGCSRQKEGQTSASCCEFHKVFGSRQGGDDSRALKPTEPGGKGSPREQTLPPHYHILESGEDGGRAKEQQPQTARGSPHGQEAEGHRSWHSSPVRNQYVHGIAFTLFLSVSCREPCVSQSRQPVATGNTLHPIFFLYCSLDIPHCISFSLG